MIVRWTDQAARELGVHYDYYRAHNPAAARQVRRSVMAGANRLRDYPRMGKPGRVEGTRERSMSCDGPLRSIRWLPSFYATSILVGC